MRNPGKAYEQALLDRGAEIAGAKEAIKARVRLAQIGVVRLSAGAPARRSPADAADDPDP